MKIIIETTIVEFKAWSGAVYTQNKIIEADKVEEFEQLIEEIFPEGCTDTELNDYLWFEDEQIFEMLGMIEESEDEE